MQNGVDVNPINDIVNAINTANISTMIRRRIHVNGKIGTFAGLQCVKSAPGCVLRKQRYDIPLNVLREHDDIDDFPLSLSISIVISIFRSLIISALFISGNSSYSTRSLNPEIPRPGISVPRLSHIPLLTQ